MTHAFQIAESNSIPKICKRDSNKNYLHDYVKRVLEHTVHIRYP